jgi:hypothetical protein
VAGVDDRVAGIDDNVAVVIDGGHLYSISYQENILSFDVPRGKTGQGSHTASSNRHR